MAVRWKVSVWNWVAEYELDEVLFTQDYAFSLSNVTITNTNKIRNDGEGVSDRD